MIQTTESTILLEFTLHLPVSLAQEAQSRGLLTAQELERLLREELRRKRVDRLFEAADRLASLPGTPFTETEIETEIQAVRRK
jgi:hypothetical protein